MTVSIADAVSLDLDESIIAFGLSLAYGLLVRVVATSKNILLDSASKRHVAHDFSSRTSLCMTIIIIGIEAG
jgi:hypothetical protein